MLLLLQGGEPGPISGSILDKVLDSYEPVVIELAKIAEEEGADVFAPMEGNRIYRLVQQLKPQSGAKTYFPK